MCWGQEAVGLNILLPPGWERCLEISPRNWEKIFLGQVGHEISSIFTGYFRWILIYLDDTRVSDGLVRDGRSHDGYTATRSSGCRQRPSQECSNLGMNSVHRSVFFLIGWLLTDFLHTKTFLNSEMWLDWICCGFTGGTYGEPKVCGSVQSATVAASGRLVLWSGGTTCVPVWRFVAMKIFGSFVARFRPTSKPNRHDVARIS